MEIIIITGQTATGKTDLAIKLAQKYNGELINCDSRQVYQNLDIITGKDFTSKNFKPIDKINNFKIGYYTVTSKIKLWLYDIVDPKQYFSSYDFTLCAISVIKELLKIGKTPIIVGGTYFYLRHLLYNIPSESIPPNWPLRKKLETESVNNLQTTLKSLNPKIYYNLNNSDRHNPRRLIRRIEILSSGRNRRKQSVTEKVALADKISVKKINYKFIALRYKYKKNLNEAIKLRIKNRIKSGAINEVAELLSRGYTEKDPGINTIGYQQLISYLKGRLTIDQAVEEWECKELQYAKRQETFIKKDTHFKFNDIDL